MDDSNKNLLEKAAESLNPEHAERNFETNHNSTCCVCQTNQHKNDFLKYFF